MFCSKMLVKLHWPRLAILFLIIILSGTLTLAYSDQAESDTSSGDICDPTTSKPCENPSEKCVWDDRDMLYKCIVRPGKPHGPRQKVPKKKRLSPPPSLSDSSKSKIAPASNVAIINTTSTMSSSASTTLMSTTTTTTSTTTSIQISSGNSSSSSNASLNSATSSTIATTAEWISPKDSQKNSMDQDPLQLLAQMEDYSSYNRSETGVDLTKFKRHNPSPPKASEKDPSGPSSVIHAEHPPSDDNEGDAHDISHAAIGRQGQSRAVDGTTSDNETERKIVLAAKTLAVPKYKGKLVWNGDPDQIVRCTPKHEMAEALQKYVPGQDKLDWLENNEDTICDFTKFFHCMMVVLEDSYLEDDISDPTTAEPMCRCYDSSMVVVNGKCYLPANFGAKSICGNITAPYPIRPWRGAPNLKPSCPPNSDCNESPYWFGKRCTCRWNSKPNPKTHGCDDAIRVGGGWLGGVVVLAGLLFTQYVVF